MYYVTRIKSLSPIVRYSKAHICDDGYYTLCGKSLTSKWWIEGQMKYMERPKTICAECRKKYNQSR